MSSKKTKAPTQKIWRCHHCHWEWDLKVQTQCTNYPCQHGYCDLCDLFTKTMKPDVVVPAPSAGPNDSGAAYGATNDAGGYHNDGNNVGYGASTGGGYQANQDYHPGDNTSLEVSTESGYQYYDAGDYNASQDVSTGGGQQTGYRYYNGRWYDSAGREVSAGEPSSNASRSSSGSKHRHHHHDKNRGH